MSDTKVQPQKIVLASSSKIRSQLMKDAGLKFSIRVGSVNEDQIKKQHIKQKKPTDTLPGKLALAKAKSVERTGFDIGISEIIIGADQIMEMDGEIFDKPKSMNEARERLLNMRGKTHRLIGSVVCIEKGQAPWAYQSETQLKMRDFSEIFIDDYLEKEGRDILQSVGAYMFERRGAQLFSTVKGDFFSILGLPLLPLLAHLRARGAVLS